MQEELYDLDADPEERNDLSRIQRQRVENMRTILSKRRTLWTVTAAPTTELSEEDVEALRHLGYISAPRTKDKKDPSPEKSEDN